MFQRANADSAAVGARTKDGCGFFGTRAESFERDSDDSAAATRCGAVLSRINCGMQRGLPLQVESR